MKNMIEIITGRQKNFRERIYYFETNEDMALGYFRQRRSLTKWDFPKFINGEVSDYTDSGGGLTEWKIFDSFEDFSIKNIFSITINGEDINTPIINEAKKEGATTIFPLLYHAQFIFDKNPDWVFNWYITTGTLTKQKKTEKYFRMVNLGVYREVGEVLEVCLKEINVK